MSTTYIKNFYQENYTIPNAVVFFFIISILAIDFLPYFQTMEIINIQFLYLSVVNLLMGIYFYFDSKFSTAPVFRILKKSHVSKFYLLFLFFCLLSFCASKNISLSITKFTELIIAFCLFINLTILLKDKLDLLYKIIFIVSISAFFQAGKELFHLRELAKSVTVLFALGEMKGNAGNINILAASLAIKVPFVILGIFHFTYFKRIFLIVTLVIVLIIIILTGARASLINLFLVFSLYIIYYLRENSFKKTYIIKSLVLIIPVLIAIFISNEIFEKSKNKDRYASVEHRISQINSEDASINARLVFWENAIKLYETSPYLGIGLGNYQIESIPYEKTTANEFNVSLHTHNDFLEILAETGLLNGLIYFSFFIYLLFINLKNILKSKNERTKTIALLILMILVVYGIDSLFNFPMYRPTMQIFFALLLALTVVNNSILSVDKPIENQSKNKINIALFIIIVSSATTYAAHIIYKASNLEYLICTDDINSNDKGVLTGDEVIRRLPQFPNVFGTSESYYEYAGIYYIREKNFEKAFNCFAKASKINPYTGRISFYKYVISNEKRNTDSSYYYIKEAFYLRPRNLMIFKAAINLAATKKDTLEILKEHKIHTKYLNSPEIWNGTVTELQRANFNRNSLDKFINQGLKYFPKDSTMSKQRNDFLITDYIIEGQDFISKSNSIEGMKSYQKALKLDPENIYVMQNIGFYYFGKNQYKEALQYYLKALKHPGLANGKTEFFIGLCYLKLNDNKNACKYLSISNERTFPNAQQMLNTYCK